MITGPEEAIKQLGALSYGGIWVVSFLSNVIIPIPEEIILLALGYLCGTGAINGFIIIPLVITALLVNDIVIFRLSRRGSRITTFLYKRFFAKHIEKKGEAWVNTNIKSIIFFSRFLMQLRFLGPFLAGNHQVEQKKFAFTNLLALIIYVPLYIGLGWYFHSRVLLIIEDVGIAKNIIIMVLGILIIFALGKLVYRYIFKRLKVDF